MPALMLLGNCVAQRLALLLAGLFAARERALPSLAAKWEVVLAPPVYSLKTGAEWEALAKRALACDLVFSQPLFHFGPCNTAELAGALGARLVTFSAPNFPAYFPDCLDARPYPQAEKYPAPLEWHSRIIAQCRKANVPVEDVENIYLNHRLFREPAAGRAVAASWRLYEKRDSHVDIASLAIARQWYASEPLFYTFNHPADRILKHLLAGILQRLGLAGGAIARAEGHIPWSGAGEPHAWAEWGFGFNAWPIITRHHSLFAFPGREWFRVGGEEVDITSAAIAWYKYYDDHPLILERVLEIAAAA